ncbi:MAG: hypothetical protein Q7R30_05060 [Acidobacteriota bacterium]|nr:hypothetical protein [Acidobacteriota bacterium]
MSDPTRDPLDQAIDRVAARLVSVDHDDAMVQRLVARLPERSGVGGWLRVLVPQAAVATALVIAALVWTTSNREQVVRDPVAAPSVAAAGVAARDVPAVPAPIVGAAAPAEATRVAARGVTETAMAEPADHERSLAPVAALVALEVVSLASPSLPEEAFVVLAPIVLTELPLSGESISPR